MNLFYRRTLGTAGDQEKLDDRLQPVPPEVFGSVVRSSETQLQHYRRTGEQQGGKCFLWLAGDSYR